MQNKKTLDKKKLQLISYCLKNLLIPNQRQTNQQLKR